MSKIEFVDLTHNLSSGIANWDGDGGFSSQIKSDYSTNNHEISFRVQDIHMHAGIGTHIDAPAHCIKGGKTVDEISITDLVAHCVVIDVSAIAHANFQFSVDNVRDFEKKYGNLSKDLFVIIRTGWDKLFYDAHRYRHNLIFPFVSKEAADYLLSKNIVGMGVDTLSPDRPDSRYPVHQAILGAGKYLVENIANSYLLPPISSEVWILPMKIKEATEAPVRMIGVIKTST